MKVLFVEAGNIPVEKELSGTLESMQELVGGTIEAIYPFDDSVALICNDEGKLLNLPMCRSLDEIEDIIYGSFFVCGTPPSAPNFTSLTSDQIKRYEKRFHFLELFLPVDDNVVFVPKDQQATSCIHEEGDCRHACP